MIISITLGNFLSFKLPTTFFLNKGINLMVGINGSGKSNFLKAIEILRKTIAENEIGSIMASMGGYEGMRNYGTNGSEPISFKFELDSNTVNTANPNTPSVFHSNPFYELAIHKFGETGFTISEKVYVINPDGTTFYYADVDRGIGFVSARNPDTGKIVREPVRTEGTVSIFEEKIDRQYYLFLHKIKTAINTIAVYRYFDLSSDSKIRKLAPYTIEKTLIPDGSNLVHILSELNANDIASFDAFKQSFNNISGTTTDIVFQNIAGNSLLLVRESGLNRTVPIQLLSEGTVKFMLLLAVLLNANSGYLIGIDEPENNLHPDMIAIVADNLKLSSVNRQLFISTHSPLLLNLFEGDDLLIFEKDAQIGTTIRRGTQEEAEELLGNRWLNGQIGAVRW